jgi:hypothetical protein
VGHKKRRDGRVGSGGASLDQTLRCASDSYKLEVRSKVAATGTKLAGKWKEVTRDSIGNISGTITGTGIKAMIDGIGFTADLVMPIEASLQSITINPTGATDISNVAITLTRICFRHVFTRPGPQSAFDDSVNPVKNAAP